MLDLTRLPDAALAPLARVVDVVLEADTGLSPDRLMVVGAYCRDLLHRALGLRFALTATHDLDLALALRSWEAYRVLAVTFPRAGTTGVRFRIANTHVDLVPFGQIEAPPGTVSPPTRGEPMSVWAFQEIHAKALPLGLAGGRTIRIPSVAGYAAAKLAAWLDRSAWGETRDAPDLALALHWYAESPHVLGRLYDTSAGNDVLIAEAADVPLASTHLLGLDVAELVGPVRLGEQLGRWPGKIEVLARGLHVSQSPQWPTDQARRVQLIEALTRGLSAAAP